MVVSCQTRSVPMLNALFHFNPFPPSFDDPIPAKKTKQGSASESLIMSER